MTSAPAGSCGRPWITQRSTTTIGRDPDTSPKVPSRLRYVVARPTTATATQTSTVAVTVPPGKTHTAVATSIGYETATAIPMSCDGQTVTAILMNCGGQTVTAIETAIGPETVTAILVSFGGQAPFQVPMSTGRLTTTGIRPVLGSAAAPRARLAMAVRAVDTRIRSQGLTATDPMADGQRAHQRRSAGSPQAAAGNRRATTTVPFRAGTSTNGMCM